MSISGYKRLVIVLSIVCVCLLVMFGSLFWTQIRFQWHVGCAIDQTWIFDEMRIKALQGDVADAAGCLEYVVRYYPSGTKQETGSQLDRVVERDRALAVRDIIVYLRTKTGEDLGDNPEAWIKKYAKR
jgi:hypothetical protein